MDEKKVNELAQKLYQLVDPWDSDYQTVDDFVINIQDDPLKVIEYLVNLLEEA